MAESNGVYVPINLDVDDAQKELDKWSKKLAKTSVEVEIKINYETELMKQSKPYREALRDAEKRLKEIADFDSKTGTWASKTYEFRGDDGITRDLPKYSAKTVNDAVKAYEKAKEAAEPYIQKLEALRNEIGKLEDEQDDATRHIEEWGRIVDSLQEKQGASATGAFTFDPMLAQIGALEQAQLQAIPPITKLDEALERMGQAYTENIAAIKKSGGAFGALGKRISGLAKRVLVFSVMTSALRELRQAFGNLVQSDTELSKQLNQLKGNFLTLISPLVNVLLPALRTLVAILNLIITQIGQLVFGLFGLSWADAQQNAKGMAKSMASGAKSAKEMQKSLMGIDEINRLDAESGTSGGGGAGGASFDPMDVTGKLLELEAAALGALVALGIILVLTGANIPLGLGLIIAGIAGLVAEMVVNWNSVTDKVRSTIAKIVGLVSGAALATGILFLLTGANVGIGLALLIAGLAGTVTALAFSWTSTEGKVKAIVTTLTQILSGAALVVGAFLLFTGANVGLGLGLIAAGIGGSALSFKWDYIAEKIKGVIQVVKDLLLSAWDWIKGIWTKLKDGFTKGVGDLKRIWGEFATVLKDKLSSAWEKVKAVFSKGGQIFDGIKEGIAETFKKIVNGLVSGINKVIAVPFNAINAAIRKIRDASILGIKPFASLSTINVPQIPYLAQGTVVPPNKEFLAMLGDNKTETEIVSPLSTMRQALLEALEQSNREQTIVINVDGRKLFEVMVNQNNNEVRRTGASPLLV